MGTEQDALQELIAMIMTTQKQQVALQAKVHLHHQEAAEVAAGVQEVGLEHSLFAIKNGNAANGKNA